MMGYQANWYLARQFGGTGRLLQSNPRTYSARSFSCGIYSMVIGGNWEPYTTSVAVGQSADLGELFAKVGLNEVGNEQCNGGYVGISTSFYYYWETLSPSIASISGPNYESFVNAQGVSPGNATIFGEVWDQYGCGWDQYVGETVTADQTPVITGISPSIWPAGTTTSVTFTCQYFGTNAPSLTFSPSSGITYSMQSGNSDGYFVANITVAPGTATENVTVSVTNNGYSGLGFYGRGSGGDPQLVSAGRARSKLHGCHRYLEFRKDILNFRRANRHSWAGRKPNSNRQYDSVDLQRD